MRPYSTLEEALLFAAKHHSRQRRDDPGGLPYALHPFEVVSNLRYIGGVLDEDTLTAAALHDILEETDVKPSTLRRKFGKHVTALVKEVTREEPTPQATKNLSEQEIWQLRSSMLLTEISKMSPAAQTIKLADRLSNLREALLTRTGARLTRYQLQTLKILESIPPEVNPPLWNAIKDLLANTQD